jgi:hypothetical protein
MLKLLSPHITGWPTGAERGCARAASPEAVEASGQLDAGRPNGVRRKEKDRPGMWVRRAGDEDRDEAVAQRFGLNAKLPSPSMGTKTTGSSAISERHRPAFPIRVEHFAHDAGSETIFGDVAYERPNGGGEALLDELLAIGDGKTTEPHS